jgi:hypothetical protein
MPVHRPSRPQPLQDACGLLSSLTGGGVWRSAGLTFEALADVEPILDLRAQVPRDGRACRRRAVLSDGEHHCGSVPLIEVFEVHGRKAHRAVRSGGPSVRMRIRVAAFYLGEQFRFPGDCDQFSGQRVMAALNPVPLLVEVQPQTALVASGDSAGGLPAVRAQVDGPGIGTNARHGGEHRTRGPAARADSEKSMVVTARRRSTACLAEFGADAYAARPQFDQCGNRFVDDGIGGSFRVTGYVDGDAFALVELLRAANLTVTWTPPDPMSGVGCQGEPPSASSIVIGLLLSVKPDVAPGHTEGAA